MRSSLCLYKKISVTSLLISGLISTGAHATPYICTIDPYLPECSEDQKGLDQVVVTGTNINTAANISSMVGNMASGRGAPGTQRITLNSTGETGLAGSADGGSWNGWLGFSHNRVGYSFNPLESSGHSNVALAGVDYTFANSAILGATVAIDRTSINTDFNNGGLDNDGFSIAPYAAWLFNKNLVLDASVGWGRSTLDQVSNNVTRVTGSTRDHRLFGALGLSYNEDVGNWRFTGKGNLLLARDRLGSFTQSDATAVAGRTSNLSQLRLSALATYAMEHVAPYAGIVYSTDLHHETQAAVGGDKPANDRNGIILQAGLNFYSSGPLSGGIMLQTEQGRREVKNDQLLANISLNF